MDKKTKRGAAQRNTLSRRDCLGSAAALAVTVAGMSLAEKARTAPQSKALFPGERIVWGAGFPSLAMFRRGDAAKPLFLFLPGGGHLARIAYGHPEGRSGDFILTHLTQAGFSTLALSYPTDHPCIAHPVPGMTMTEWAETCAAIAAHHIAQEQLPTRVVAAGWSLGGRLARDIAVALKQHGVDLEFFVALSSPPPMPGFGSLKPSDLELTPAGLRNDSGEDSPIFRSRERHLASIDAINGHIVLPRRIYAEQYVADSPINFRGEPERYRNRGLVTDIAAAIADQGSFDFQNYPLTGAISGTSTLDSLHALTGPLSWGMLNAQALFHQLVKPAIAKRQPTPAEWTQVHELMRNLTRRLSRHVEGGHFFFVGETGARATVGYILALMDQGAAIKSELTALLGRAH